MKVGIIGAGFAGVAAAQEISKKGVEVTLFSAEKVLPYYRPRLPEFAFGQEDFDDIFFCRLDWYVKNNIDLRLDTRVKAFTPGFEIHLEDDSREKFDALIIATGASPVIPSFVRESSAKTVFTMWDYSASLEIRKLMKSRKQLAIIGGGLIGVESALRAEVNDLSITIIDKNPHLVSRNFDRKASVEIETQLRNRNINILLGNDVCAISEAYNNMITVDMANKDGFLCDFVVLADGVWFDTSMAVEAGLKTDNRVLVDEHLQTSLPGIFAAGDIAQLPKKTACSAEEATRQGEFVGQNVLTYLRSKPLRFYTSRPVPSHLEYRDFENYSLGKIPHVNNREKILSFEDMKLYRDCVYEYSSSSDTQASGKHEKVSLLEKIWGKSKGR